MSCDGRIGMFADEFVREQMKQAFDPLCLLNCDKIVRAQMPKPGEVQEW